jgi:hypothetical protein
MRSVILPFIASVASAAPYWDPLEEHLPKPTHWDDIGGMCQLEMQDMLEDIHTIDQFLNPIPHIPTPQNQNDMGTMCQIEASKHIDMKDMTPEAFMSFHNQMTTDIGKRTAVLGVESAATARPEPIELGTLPPIPIDIFPAVVTPSTQLHYRTVRAARPTRRAMSRGVRRDEPSQVYDNLGPIITILTSYNDPQDEQAKDHDADSMQQSEPTPIALPPKPSFDEEVAGTLNISGSQIPYYNYTQPIEKREKRKYYRHIWHPTGLRDMLTWVM